MYSYRSWNLIAIGSVASARAFTGEIVTAIVASMSFRAWIICAKVNLKIIIKVIKYLKLTKIHKLLNVIGIIKRLIIVVVNLNE